MSATSKAQPRPKREPDAPNATESEKELLGAILNGEPFERIQAALQVNDFSSEFHRRVFTAMGTLHGRGEVIEPTTVFEDLQRQNLPEKLSDICALTCGLPDGRLPNIDSLIRIVKRKAGFRDLAGVGSVLRESALLEIDAPEAIAARARQNLNGIQPAAEAEEHTPTIDIPTFPDIAWRGLFGAYRQVMDGTTEACDVAHFATIWAVVAAILGRLVWMFSGDRIFANVYLMFFGPTGDKKTTAERRFLSCGLLADYPEVKIIKNAGSTEGLAKAISGAEIFLLFWEEFSALLARARWKGSTLLEFITECFDCPDTWGTSYQTNSIELVKPTPTILTASTPEWFWKNSRADDYYGGFGNRFFNLAGPKKPPIPNPIEPDPHDLRGIKNALASLGHIKAGPAEWDDSAKKLWAAYYVEFEGRERTGLLGAAVKRAHAYTRKLAMAYAAVEGTLPKITRDQLMAAIAVTQYEVQCTEQLIDLQAVQSKPQAELEDRFLSFVKRHPGERLRRVQQKMSRYCGDADTFNKVKKSLEQSDRIEIRDRRVYLTT